MKHPDNTEQLMKQKQTNKKTNTRPIIPNTIKHDHTFPDRSSLFCSAALRFVTNLGLLPVKLLVIAMALRDTSSSHPNAAAPCRDDGAHGELSSSRFRPTLDLALSGIVTSLGFDPPAHPRPRLLLDEPWWKRPGRMHERRRCTRVYACGRHRSDIIPILIIILIPKGRGG